MAEVYSKPLALVILDGWGYSPEHDGNAIALAHTPNYDFICQNFPSTLLSASGDRVGLSPGDPGDSETGHRSIGAGRVVKPVRELVREALENGTLSANEPLNRAFERASSLGNSIHLIGLISDAGIHSLLESLFSLLRLAKNKGINEKIFIHCILDGKDVSQRTADVYVEMLEIKLAEIGVGRIASLCGRHYAMDSEGHWDRTARAFTMLVHSEGEPAVDPVDAIHGSFLRGISDEFIQPIVIEEPIGTALAKVGDGDVVVFFNHKPEGMRQLVRALAVPDPGTGGFGKPNISAFCLTEYDQHFELPVLLGGSGVQDGLSRAFADNGVYNCRVTESDKFDLVTKFFNGGSEGKHPCEQRVSVPSKRGAELEAPEMGAFKVTDRLLRGLETGENDVFIVNLAAADLVAHTGNLEKTVEAVQYVDTCLGGILNKIREVGGTAIITADHGNIEQMMDPGTGRPNAGHTDNPVPFHLVTGGLNGLRLREDGALEDVAPTVLGILGIEKPEEMTGRDLRM